MALNCGDGTHSPLWMVTQVSSGASGSPRGGGAGSGGGGGGAGGGATAGRAEVVAPDRALHPASAVRTTRQESDSQKRIATHPIAYTAPPDTARGPEVRRRRRRRLDWMRPWFVHTKSPRGGGWPAAPDPRPARQRVRLGTPVSQTGTRGAPHRARRNADLPDGALLPAQRTSGYAPGRATSRWPKPRQARRGAPRCRSGDRRSKPAAYPDRCPVAGTAGPLLYSARR